jgi:hypothetical protein
LIQRGEKTLKWRKGEPSNPSLSEAIRDLIMRGLSAAYAEREEAARKKK